MEKSIEFEKTISKGKGYLVAAIIFLIISIFLTAVMYFGYQDDMQNPIKLIDANEEGKYASVNVSLMTDNFATNDYSDTTHKTYFILDEENILYIADIDEENLARLQEVYNYSYSDEESAVAPESVEIKGMTKEIPDDLKQIAIESYNEMFDENYLDNSNFSDYFGLVYLDTYESPMTDFTVSLVIIIPIVIIGLVFMVIYFVNKNNTKKTKQKYADNWDKIINEINDENSLYYKNIRLYLTKNYLISYQNGLKIIDYKDVIWMYPHEYRYNGFVTQKSIYVVTRNSKTHNLITLGISKKNKILFEEIYNTLINKMPDILNGYTKENIKAAKELYQK